MLLCHKLSANTHYYFDLHCRIFPDRLIWRGTISRKMAINIAALNKGTLWVHWCHLWMMVFFCSWLLRSGRRGSLWASLQASWAQRGSGRAAPPSPAAPGEQAESANPSSTWVNQFKVSDTLDLFQKLSLRQPFWDSENPVRVKSLSSVFLYALLCF